MSTILPSNCREIRFVTSIKRHWRNRRSRRPDRGRTVLRPGVEGLEERVVLAIALDATFGQAGVIYSPASTVLIGSSAVVVQPDGKIVVATIAGPGEGPDPLNDPIGIRRYNADGTLDTLFGTGGETIVAVRSHTNYEFIARAGYSPHNIVVGPDGTIVFAVYDDGSFDLPQQSILIRLTASGQLDSTFGTEGKFTIPQFDGSLQKRFDAVAIQPDGKIVVGGIFFTGVPDNSDQSDLQFPEPAVVRLTPSGALDTTFNQTGVQYLILPLANGYLSGASVSAVAIAPAGKILVAANNFVGAETTSSTIVAFNPDGTIDTTYGTGGVGTMGLTTSNSVNDIAIQSDGKVIMAGVELLPVTLIYESEGSLFVGIVNRLDANGVLDPEFQPFVSQTEFLVPYLAGTSQRESFNAVVVGKNGRITAGGMGPTIQRLLPSGAPDLSFGVDGKIVGIPVPTANPSFFQQPATLAGLALTPDNKVVTVGAADRSHVQNTYPITRAAVYVARFTAPGGVLNDYGGTSISDIATYLPALGAFTIRPSSGTPDEVIPFGIPGAGQSIAVPGD